MEYRTAFDIAVTGYKSWSFPARGLIFVALGGVLLARREHRPAWLRSLPRPGVAFGLVFLGFAVVWTCIAFLSTYGEYARLNRAIKSGDVGVVEGVVSQFTPMPATGHGMERFCVGDVCFEYSDYAVTNGFNHTSSHGGPIRQGLPVRVTYDGNKIVKLEVAR